MCGSIRTSRTEKSPKIGTAEKEEVITVLSTTTRHFSSEKGDGKSCTSFLDRIRRAVAFIETRVDTENIVRSCSFE